MKDDEFAFFNQQLAAMLRDGIPLEGALRRLCQEMRAGSLRTELQALETDLAKGTPMADALAPRQLPELYKRMILVGVKSGDLPGALTMLADYFQRQNNTWTRLKSLMVYPIIVLLFAFFLSLFLVVPSWPFHLEQFKRIERILRQSCYPDSFSWFMGTAHIVWADFGGNLCRSYDCTNPRNVALAIARLQRGKLGTSRVCHLADVEKWRRI